MEFYVLRNKSQVDDLCKTLRDRRLPYKVAVQDIYPKRSVSFNDYLWGFIYTPIAEFTGHTPDEIHEHCKKKFNFRWEFEYNTLTKKFDLLCKGTTTRQDRKAMADYAMEVRAWAEMFFHITLLMPNETFFPELNFERENAKFDGELIVKEP